MVALVSGAVQLVGATPASAAALGLLGGTPKPTVTLSSPSSGGMEAFKTTSPVVTGTAVPGDQAGNGVISAVKVVISSSAGHPGTTFDLAPQAPTSGSTWTFSGSPLIPIAYNGQYSVTVTVTETDTPLLGSVRTGTASTSVGLAEDVPPVAPTGVTADVTGARKVTVSWSPNPEPDTLGYVVLRSTGTGASSELGSTATTSYVDNTPQVGVRYTYSVVALRAGDAPGSSLYSPPSSGVSTEVSGTAPSSSGTTKSGTTKSGTTKSGSTKSGSTGSVSGQSGTATTPSAPLLTQSALTAQYQADIAAAGNAGAPSPASSAPASSASSGGTTSGSSVTGAPKAGGFSEVLPYPKGQSPSGAQTAADPAATPGPSGASGSRVRTLATVALGMIFLVVAALAIRLVLRVRRG